MKTKILRQVNRYVRVVKTKHGYETQARVRVGVFKGFGEWQSLNVFSTFKKAVEKKNMHIVMVVMRELGYRNELVRRRTNRNREKGWI